MKFKIKRIYIFILQAMLFINIGIGICAAYSLDTHQNITQYSVDTLIYNDVKLSADLRTYKDLLIAANRAEDDPPNWLEHFYNPATGLGLLGTFGTAKLRAEGYYYLALHHYMTNNESAAWDRIGHALHLLQDMSVPAHVQGTSHVYHSFKSVGYEAWVGNSAIWGAIISPYIDDLQKNNPYFRRPITGAGSMGNLMEMTAGQTYWGGYDYDNDLTAHVVSPYEADYASKILIPQAILSSGSLFQMFWRAVGSGGTPPPPTGGFNNAHPDDNFDVSSRLIQLEELDPSKEIWKDLYGRTGTRTKIGVSSKFNH